MTDKQQIDNGGPAFPTTELYYDGEGKIIDSASQGMSTRMWLAGKAMQALVSRDTEMEMGGHPIHGESAVAAAAFILADAMLAAARKDTPDE